MGPDYTKQAERRENEQVLKAAIQLRAELEAALRDSRVKDATVNMLAKRIVADIGELLKKGLNGCG